MRYALVSDIHANLQAWQPVLLDIRSNRVDEIICLGDIVGYGPNPAEVLQSVHTNVNHLVLGNHDAVVCGKLDPELFNDAAREIIQWTRARLTAEAVTFLRSLPLSLKGAGFRCTHGDFANPAAYNYVIEPADALASWQAVAEPLLFVGHSHQPGIFVIGASGTPHLLPPQDFVLEDGKRFLVNVGSAGQPRDGDARASYCLYDTEARAILWRRIPFDLDAYRAALARTGVSAAPSYFLRHDPRAGTPPLRQLLNFSPATTAAQAVRDAVPVQEITALQKSVRRWKTLTATVVLLGLAAAGSITAAWWRHHGRAMRVDGTSGQALDAGAQPAEHNLLPALASPGVPGHAVPNWIVELGNKRRQSVRVQADAESGPVAVLASATTRDPLLLSTGPIRAAPGQRFAVEGLFRREEDFTGTVATVVSITKRHAGQAELVDQFVVKEPSLPRAGGWMKAQATFTLPAHTETLAFQIRARFTGEVRVKGLALVRKE